MSLAFTGDKGYAHLQQAYELLRNVVERATGDGPETVGQDLYVLCAEAAFKVNVDLI